MRGGIGLVAREGVPSRSDFKYVCWRSRRSGSVDAIRSHNAFPDISEEEPALALEVSIKS